MFVQIPTCYGLPTGEKLTILLEITFVSQFSLLKVLFVGQKKILTVWLNGIDCPSADGKKVVTDVEVEGPACKLKKLN